MIGKQPGGSVRRKPYLGHKQLSDGNSVCVLFLILETIKSFKKKLVFFKTTLFKMNGLCFSLC